MILGVKTLHFLLLMLCAFAAGALGAGMVLFMKRVTGQKERTNANKNPALQSRIAQRAQRQGAVSDWSKTARDEQLYNGR